MHSWKSWMKLNNNPKRIKIVNKSALISGFAAVVIIVAACGERVEEKAKPMVYEGMGLMELETVLGRPDSIVAGGTVYDVEAGKKKSLERWHYTKRTVVVIDDTVKVPNEMLPKK